MAGVVHISGFDRFAAVSTTQGLLLLSEDVLHNIVRADPFLPAVYCAVASTCHHLHGTCKADLHELECLHGAAMKLCRRAGVMPGEVQEMRKLTLNDCLNDADCLVISRLMSGDAFPQLQDWRELELMPCTRIRMHPTHTPVCVPCALVCCRSSILRATTFPTPGWVFCAHPLARSHSCPDCTSIPTSEDSNYDSPMPHPSCDM